MVDYCPSNLKCLECLLAVAEMSQGEVELKHLLGNGCPEMRERRLFRSSMEVLAVPDEAERFFIDVLERMHKEDISQKYDVEGKFISL
jgi:hypothetical protein